MQSSAPTRSASGIPHPEQTRIHAYKSHADRQSIRMAETAIGEQLLDCLDFLQRKEKVQRF